MTPTVKRQIGATTINIDSRDMNNFEFIKLIAGLFLKVMRIYIYLVRIDSKFYKLLSKKEKKIKKHQLFHNSSYLLY